MPLPRPRNGAVIRYAYLWHTEQQRGQLEATKDRPAAVVLAHEEAATGRTQVFVLPVTHSPPAADSAAIEIPPAEKHALGLDGERSWIVCNEANRFLWPGYDLRPIPGTKPPRWEYGMLSRGLYDKVRALFLECRNRGRGKTAGRD